MLLLFDGHACGPLAVPTGGRVRPYTGLSGPLQRTGGPAPVALEAYDAVRGDSGGRPESPRVLRTAPGRILPSRVRSYGATRGADATLCGGASTSSPPARTRCARVTVRSTHPGTACRSDREESVHCVRVADVLVRVVPFLRVSGPGLRSMYPDSISRSIDGSVPIDIDADCSRRIARSERPLTRSKFCSCRLRNTFGARTRSPNNRARRAATRHGDIDGLLRERSHVKMSRTRATGASRAMTDPQGSAGHGGDGSPIDHVRALNLPRSRRSPRNAHATGTPLGVRLARSTQAMTPSDDRLASFADTRLRRWFGSRRRIALGATVALVAGGLTTRDRDASLRRRVVPGRLHPATRGGATGFTADLTLTTWPARP